MAAYRTSKDVLYKDFPTETKITRLKKIPAKSRQLSNDLYTPNILNKVPGMGNYRWQFLLKKNKGNPLSVFELNSKAKHLSLLLYAKNGNHHFNAPRACGDKLRMKKEGSFSRTIVLLKAKR